MASVLGRLLQHLVLVCLLCLGLPNTTALASGTCPAKCNCLGNIVDCSGTDITFLPKNISKYPWIEELQLNKNPGLNLTGNDLPLLPHLGVLELEKLGLLEFPTLGQLPSLRKLSLRDNELSAVGSLAGASNLRHLDLSRNSLTALPADLLLPHLTKLNLDRNRITRVVGIGAGLPALQELRMVKNGLTEEALVSSGLLHSLPALTSLNLNQNQLRGLPSLVFQNCSALHHLKLSRNRLSSLSDGVFFGLTNLRTLFLDQNNLTEVSNKWLFGLGSLKTISLRHNNIVSLSPSAWHDTTPNLQSIDLSYNKLVSLHPSFLKGLSKLEDLNMSNNYLSVIMSETFKNTPNLLLLDLSYNKLRWSVEDGGSAYVGLSKLQSISLAHNNIEAVQYEALAPLTHLIKLDLRGNNIKTLIDNPFRNIQYEPTEPDQLLMNTTSMVCDCHLSWLQDWLRTTQLDLSQMRATCQYPPLLVNTALIDLPDKSLPCALSPRPVILSSPEDRIVLLEADVELKCEAKVGSRGGQPMLMWRHDNQLIDPYKLEEQMSVEEADPDGGVISRVTSWLQLNRVTHQDAGKYQCVVRNTFGAVYSQPALIEVQVKPYFTVLPVTIHTQVDDVARLECAAEGLPPPEISLQKGGSDDFPAARERRMFVDDSKDTVFLIKPVTPSDEGTYTCTANSTAGITRATANITVSQPPFFLQPVHDATVRPGDSAVMHCQGLGRPAPSISWVREGVVLGSSNTRHVSVDGGEFLIVLDVRSEDAGPYTCQLTNTYGTRRQTMQLTVFDGLLVDGQTTLGLVMMAVVVCVVVTSMVWVIIIYHTKRRRRPNHHPALGYPPSTSSSPLHLNHNHMFPGDNSPAPTDPMLAEDPSHTTDIVLAGPDTGSEHSTGKDSGVGDSSQRSSEDLRQLPNCVVVGPGGTAQLPLGTELMRQTPAARSALMVYADQNNLPAIVRGGSSLSMATDSDVRYDDCRPRLSTFGAGGSATLRRPSGHRPIPVAVPCVLPGRHSTATLPHKHSFRARNNKLLREPLTSTAASNTDADSALGLDEMKSTAELDDSDLSSANSPARSIGSNPRTSIPAYSHFNSHYKDPNPYSKPNNKILGGGRLPNMLNSRTNSPLPSPQYMSAKCITSDSTSGANSPVSSPQYMSATNTGQEESPLHGADDSEPVYGTHGPRHIASTASSVPAQHGNSAYQGVTNNEEIYKQQRQLSVPGQPLHPRPSDYSTPSIVYSPSGGVEIAGLSPAMPPPPPPPPSSKPSAPCSPLYDRAPLLSAVPLASTLWDPSVPR